jgi:hypothetical protein
MTYGEDKMWTPEEDIAILKALYFGNHLEDRELERASKLVHLLEVAMKERLK